MLKRRVWIPLAGVIFAVTLAAVALFFHTLLKVDFLIGDYLALVVAIFAFIVYLSGVLLFFGMRKKPSSLRRVRRIIGILLCVVVTVGSLIGAYLLNGVSRAKETVTTVETNRVAAVIGIYVKKDDAAQTLADTAQYPYGVLFSGNEKIYTNYILGEIKEQIGTEVSANVYPGISDLAGALRDESVKAIAVNKVYLSLLSESENYRSFSDEIRLIDEIPVSSAVTLDDVQLFIKPADQPAGHESAPKSASVREETPLVIDGAIIFYISGIDKHDGAEAANNRSDVNILMAVNPTTRQILFLNTPRDYFVVNPAHGAEDKLTHCGIDGVSNSIAALEGLYNVQIDKYARVNFDGFVRFIDAIGGITLDNPTAFWNNFHTDYFSDGTITMDGREALIYVREREAFGDGDLARGRNQIRVLIAIVEQMKKSGASILLNYNSILNSMANSFETDLTSDQISDLVKIASKNLTDWDIKSYSVSGYSGLRVTATGGSEPLFIVFPKEDTVVFASDLLDMIENNEIITDEILANAPSPY